MRLWSLSNICLNSSSVRFERINSLCKAASTASLNDSGRSPHDFSGSGSGSFFSMPSRPALRIRSSTRCMLHEGSAERISSFSPETGLFIILSAASRLSKAQFIVWCSSASPLRKYELVVGPRKTDISRRCERMPAMK